MSTLKSNKTLRDYLIQTLAPINFLMFKKDSFKITRFIPMMMELFQDNEAFNVFPHEGTNTILFLLDKNCSMEGEYVKTKITFHLTYENAQSRVEIRNILVHPRNGESPMGKAAIFSFVDLYLDAAQFEEALIENLMKSVIYNGREEAKRDVKYNEFFRIA